METELCPAGHSTGVLLTPMSPEQGKGGVEGISKQRRGRKTLLCTEWSLYKENVLQCYEQVGYNSFNYLFKFAETGREIE